MSNVARNIVLATALVTATGLSFAARQGSASFTNPLRVSALADTSTTEAFTGTVQFKITNNSREAIKVPYWQLPGASEESRLFQVYRNGAKVDYLGKMIKRLPPTEAELVTIEPYETKVISVDLSKSYDLSRGGVYSVAYGTYLEGARTKGGRRLAAANGRAASLQSAPLSLWVESKGMQSGAKRPPSGGGTVVNGVSYVGCSSTQINGAGSAVSAARNYSENAKGYLNGGSAGPRYTTWFGVFTSARYNTVQGNFGAIDSAMDMSNGEIKINCGCNQSYYAYVYPTRPYEIFVCRAFWSAPNTGTDSKAGTLIHEMSHFNVVAGTDDHVYGQAGAKQLAIDDPNRAVANADSHEYFAENTPSQN